MSERVVYFMTPRDGGPIRIGYCSNSVESRRGGTQAHSPVEIVTLATIPGHRIREAMLHQKFGYNRLHGEWFRPDALLWGTIAEAQACGDIHRLPPEISGALRFEAVADGLAGFGVSLERAAAVFQMSTAAFSPGQRGINAPVYLGAMFRALSGGWMTIDEYESAKHFSSTIAKRKHLNNSVVSNIRSAA